MGEALLMNHGGMRYKALIVDPMPNKLSYVVCGSRGQTIDLTGAKIIAKIGTNLVTLTPDNYSYLPTGEVESSDSAIVVSATLGHKIRQVSIPITIVAPDPILNNNDWDVIALVSSSGLASSVWSVGDTKSETIAGVTKTFRIIGFNHDDLADSDELVDDVKYNAAAYDSTNQIRYAGITFQATTAFGTSKMNASDTNVDGWYASYMRTTTMQTVYAMLPQSMRDVIRTVNIRANVGGYGSGRAGQLNLSEDELFILSVAEMVANNSDVASAENSALTVYEYYETEDISKGNAIEWTRSPHDPLLCADSSHFLFVNTNNTIGGNSNSGNASNVYDYYPAFCV